MEVVKLARIVRSGFEEGGHHGAAVALDPDGKPLLAAGSVTEPVFPRSSNKPMQAVAMLRAGLGAGVPGHLLALAASSHSGEAYHRDGVLALLASAGLGEADLRNTPDLPYGAAERLVWDRLGRPASPLAQNCSGKHAAMLVTCVRNGWDTAGYLDPGHPLQQAITATIADLTGAPVDATGVDGCGAPVHAVSLTHLATAFSRLATASPGTPEGRVAAAIRTHPEWLGGTGRDVTALLRGVPGLIAKDGAEGVYAAALPDGSALALKIWDGAERARPVVMAALLRRLGVDSPFVDALSTVPVLGHGEAVGVLEAVALGS